LAPSFFSLLDFSYLTYQTNLSGMADPLTYINLASSIITFVEFGYKVIVGTKQVRSSVQGTTQELKELDLIVEDIRLSNDLVKKNKPVGRQHTDDEIRILAMVKECETIYTELRKITNKLIMRTGARSKTLESGRVALHSVWKHNGIQELRGRLSALDERIRINVELALQK
jgi:hypothetical protein